MGHIASCPLVCFQALRFILGELGRHADVKRGCQIEVAGYIVLFDELVYLFEDKPFIGDDLQGLFGAMDFRVGIKPTKGI